MSLCLSLGVLREWVLYHLVCIYVEPYSHLTRRSSGGSDLRRRYLVIFCLVTVLLTSLLPFASQAQVAVCAPYPKPLHIVLLGDSNTALGGDRCDQPKGWNKWFCERINPSSCRSYARSGATWTNTPKTRPNTTENIGRIGHDNVVSNQINRLIEAYEEGRQVYPDVVIIAAGTNDIWFESARPKAFAQSVEEAFALSDECLLERSPAEVLSLPLSVRYGCLRLRKSFPDALVIVLTPLQSVAVPGEGIERTGDVIEATASRMGLPVIRQDKVCVVSRKDEAKKYLYTYDGTHTSVLGAQKNGAILAELIRPLIDKHTRH